MKEKRLLSFGFLFLLTLALAVYSSQSQSSGKTVIKVTTDSDVTPSTCKENDTFKGYDTDAVKTIFKDSKKYKTEFVTTAFDSISTGVDADCYQIATNDFNYNEECIKKYPLLDPTSKPNYTITNIKRTSYDSLDDLSGKSTEVISGPSYAQALEKWNDENSDKEPVRINYASSLTEPTTRVQYIESGTVDFILHDAISSSYLVEDQGFNLAMTNVTDDVSGGADGLGYLLFVDTNEGTKLQKFVNKHIEELEDNGTLAGLSEQCFGGDFISAID